MIVKMPIIKSLRAQRLGRACAKFIGHRKVPRDYTYVVNEKRHRQKLESPPPPPKGL